MRRMTAAARLEVELDHGVGEHEQDGPCKGQPKSLRPPETFKRSQPHQKRVFTRWEGLVGLKVVPPEQPASKSTSTIAQSLTDFPQDHRRTLTGWHSAVAPRWALDNWVRTTSPQAGWPVSRTARRLSMK